MNDDLTSKFDRERKRLVDQAAELAGPDGRIAVSHVPEKAGRDQSADEMTRVGSMSQEDFISNGMEQFRQRLQL